MRVIRTRWIPFKRFKAMNFFGVILARRGVEIDERTNRHEKIHTEQMKELWYVFFYIYYFLEWILRGFNYRAISFEREAYDHDWDWDYLEPGNAWSRKPYAWREYLWRP